MTFVSDGRADHLQALDPANINAHGMYGLTLDVLILVAFVAWRRLSRWQTRAPSTRARNTLRGVLALIAVMVVLLAVPYRFMWKADEFERADFGSEPCFILGDSADEFLLYCPDSAVPRTRTVPKTSAGLKRLHVPGNIYRHAAAR
jgi:hypothetical protein